MKKYEYYSTSDLSLATTISLWFPLDLVDKSNPSKALFLFVRDNELDQLIERYWRGDVLVEPKTYFSQLKNLKSRLYGEG